MTFQPRRKRDLRARRAGVREDGRQARAPVRSGRARRFDALGREIARHGIGRRGRRWTRESRGAKDRRLCRVREKRKTLHAR